jgi:hypothetical protein
MADHTMRVSQTLRTNADHLRGSLHRPIPAIMAAHWTAFHVPGLYLVPPFSILRGSSRSALIASAG